MYNYNSGETKSCVEKFKRMLKTNMNYYFDPQEFEEIIVYYLSHGDKQLAKRALRMGTTTSKFSRITSFTKRNTYFR